MRPDEIATVCYVRFGRRPDYRTVERVLAEEPMPLRMVRRFPPYRGMEEPRERRTAVVRLHADGWNVKSIASYQTDSVIPLAMRAPTMAENLRRGSAPELAANPRAWHPSGPRRCRRGARSGRGFAGGRTIGAALG